jgi:hypothetical protein
VIGVDAAEVMDATMARHCIERMTIIRTWDDRTCAHVWTVRAAAPYGLIVESEPHERLPDAMVEAVQALSDARREIVRHSAQK